MTGGLRVLVVEDNADQAFLVGRTLRRHTPPMDVTLVGSATECLDALAASSYSVVLLDHHLPGASGLEILGEIQARGTSLPVVMVTGQGDERVAVEAMKAGAADYVVKTKDYFASLPAVILKAVKQHALALDNARLDQEARRRLRETEGLLAVAQALGASLDRDEIARRTTRELAALLEADTVEFLALDPVSATLGVRAAWGAPGGLGAADIVLTPTEMEALCSDHTLARARLPLPLRAPSVWCVPVSTAERCFGALVGGCRANTPAPTGEDERLAGGVAKQMALALENARLYQETQDALAEVKQAQERLVQGNTLRALGEMAAGTAHHLNNLLAIALGRAQLLRRSRPEPPPALLPGVAIIEQALLDAAAVVRRMQRFTRTGPAEDPPQPIDLNRILNEVREMTATQCVDTHQARGIPIAVCVESAPIPPVLASAAALREAVTNLVLNALDAMPRGGVITLRTFQDATGVCLAVSDNGVGMPADVKRRALEPFFTTKGPKGTGLGLSVAYGIMDRHGGDLRIDSSEGSGTTVTLRLPAMSHTAAPAAPVAPGRAAASPDALHILLVDDDDRVRAVLADMLRADGHRVLQASSGVEALAVLERGVRVDLVLTDHGMPCMTGLDLTREIKTRRSDLRVGLVTGWGESIDGLTTGGGPDFTLAKPVESATLRRALGGRTLAPVR
jgi:signal transduction histidine kinase/DNA-binding response OmpR family regulator